ncbi:MAG: glycine/sarcosine/betaine reductase selenoprotein B family protein [Pseudomonadales bacterium]|jgi:D-proline reductase (dithiol) PrdB|nr:glycine/sarcosine/betaine reductase selenoprotein B family protein [Pseudomonadales bacterium]MDP6471368.1 glycine/sarcosine/betaine reductase selenoprotein B family protein [Pseudomonadales bacterium]MDP6826440.1 glycine/sarcosine/betaine reductase selenoprotein B family protein [Pseudomonadales bacterium]MDP6970993.1 glycine/sarcosine/betaine reductase selenoprotein B family protein [Pseudomonadales bacterium]|tara:strand:- start:3375 stop:3875 length:501 start_codon:yes stop_codon:yes gene_type:complete
MIETVLTDPVDYIQRTREQYDDLGFPPYAWVYNEDAPPFTPLSVPLSEARVGLVASGGIYRSGQIAFHYKDDFSFRVIDTQTQLSELRVTHFAYDLRDARADPNVVFPLQTLRDLATLSRIGELGPNAYTFMGGIYSSRKVRDALAPAIADRLQRDEVDTAILVPV